MGTLGTRRGGTARDPSAFLGLGRRRLMPPLLDNGNRVRGGAIFITRGCKLGQGLHLNGPASGVQVRRPGSKRATRILHPLQGLSSARRPLSREEGSGKGRQGDPGDAYLDPKIPQNLASVALATAKGNPRPPSFGGRAGLDGAPKLASLELRR